ncbi:MAG: DUF58 domain-containing protein [Thermoleophilaceae bacterium]
MRLPTTVTALLGLALCMLAAGFDTGSLYVPGLALVGLAVAAPAWVALAAAGASVRRVSAPRTVVEDEPFEIVVEGRAGLLPPPAGELVEPLLGRALPMAGRRERRLRVDVSLPRRGRHDTPPARLTLRDPLRLAMREVATAPGEPVLVLPRVEPIVAGGGGGGGAGDGLDGLTAGRSAGRGDSSVAELEVDGIRAYREGAPASRIHWPTVARRGEAVERALVAQLDSAPLVVLDASAPASEAALDSAVRAAASLCLALARAGGCALLLPGDRRPREIGRDLGGWPAARARLALVQESARPPGKGRIAPRAGAVLWVTAADCGTAPRALEHVRAGTRHVVTPSGPPGGRPAFAVAGCGAYPVARKPRKRLA